MAGFLFLYPLLAKAHGANGWVHWACQPGSARRRNFAGNFKPAQPAARQASCAGSARTVITVLAIAAAVAGSLAATATLHP